MSFFVDNGLRPMFYRVFFFFFTEFFFPIYANERSGRGGTAPLGGPMENYLPKCGNKKECNECRTVGPSFTGFLSSFTGFYWVLTRSDRI